MHFSGNKKKPARSDPEPVISSYSAVKLRLFTRNCRFFPLFSAISVHNYKKESRRHCINICVIRWLIRWIMIQGTMHLIERRNRCITPSYLYVFVFSKARNNCETVRLKCSRRDYSGRLKDSIVSFVIPIILSISSFSVIALTVAFTNSSLCCCVAIDIQPAGPLAISIL